VARLAKQAPAVAEQGSWVQMLPAQSVQAALVDFDRSAPRTLGAVSLALQPGDWQARFAPLRQRPKTPTKRQR